MDGYSYYTKNILLHQDFIKKVNEVKNEPTGIFQKIWNWKPEKDYLALQLLREWSIHGVKYIGQKDRHIVERLFWLITVISSTGFAIYYSKEVVDKYYSSPVIVSFQPKQTSVAQVPFPAVTICNVNHFKKSALKEALRIAEEAAKGNEAKTGKVANMLLLLKELDHVCSATKSFGHRFNFSLEETTVGLSKKAELENYFFTEFTDVAPEDVYGHDHRQILHSAFQSCEDMIPLCLWEGEEIDCSKSFFPITTDFGLCCTFNMVPMRVMLNLKKTDPTLGPHESLIPDEEVKQWADFNMDSSIVSDEEKPVSTLPRHQSKAGQTSGLSVLLDPDLEEYFCASHDAFGFRVFTHSPIEFPHPLEFGMAVGPNVEMFLNAQAEVTIAEKLLRTLTFINQNPTLSHDNSWDVKRLHTSGEFILPHWASDSLKKYVPEERHCYFLNEKPLGNYVHYTSTNCVDECVMNLTIANCSCVSYDMHQTSGNRKPFCGHEKLSCVDDVKRDIGRQGTKYFCSSCYPNCNRIVYDVQTSSLPIRKDVNIWQSSDPQRRDWSNRNVSIIHVYFGSDSVYTRVRKRLFDAPELFASVGGILGLFIGFSVISLVEPIYFVIRFFTHKPNDDDDDEEEEDDN